MFSTWFQIALFCAGVILGCVLTSMYYKPLLQQIKEETSWRIKFFEEQVRGLINVE